MLQKYNYGYLYFILYANIRDASMVMLIIILSVWTHLQPNLSAVDAKMYDFCDPVFISVFLKSTIGCILFIPFSMVFI